jgi:hypothetical protein
MADPELCQAIAIHFDGQARWTLDWAKVLLAEQARGFQLRAYTATPCCMKRRKSC